MTKAELIEELKDCGKDLKELKSMSKKELQNLYNDIYDVSDIICNESEEDFWEHEDFD